MTVRRIPPPGLKSQSRKNNQAICLMKEKLCLYGETIIRGSNSIKKKAQLVLIAGHTFARKWMASYLLTMKPILGPRHVKVPLFMSKLTICHNALCSKPVSLATLDINWDTDQFGKPMAAWISLLSARASLELGRYVGRRRLTLALLASDGRFRLFPTETTLGVLSMDTISRLHCHISERCLPTTNDSLREASPPDDMHAFVHRCRSTAVR